MLCKRCNIEIEDEAVCPYCKADNSPKSRYIAGFLQILCGTLGAGRFYLGYKKTGFLQIAVSVLTMGIGGVIWGIIDGVRMINGKVLTDNSGRPLAD